MARVAMTQKLSASAEQVWGRIGGFDTFTDWNPRFEKSEIDGSGVGATRNMFVVGGGNIIERLDAEDAAGRSYTYTLLESPLPIANYQSTIKVVDNGDGSCTVDWSAEFDTDGVSEEELVEGVQGRYRFAFDALIAEFGE